MSDAIGQNLHENNSIPMGFPWFVVDFMVRESALSDWETVMATLEEIHDDRLMAALLGCNPPDYLGPERQLPGAGGTYDPVREALAGSRPRSLPEPPPDPASVRKSLPEGWTYLGPRETSKGLLWEAQHRLGVAWGHTPGELIARCLAIHAAVKDEGSAAEMQGFNRRRKRRARRDRDLVRCQAPLCAGLFWPDQMEDHVKHCHPGFKGFAPVARVEDDGTGEDITLDDPSVARRVEAEV